jgi:hypothetical protein
MDSKRPFSEDDKTPTDPPSDSIESRITRMEVAVKMLQKEFVDDRREKTEAINENSKALGIMADAVRGLTAELREERTERKRHNNIADQRIDSLWDKLSKTPAGKAGLSAAMAGAGIVVLKIIEALPALLSLAQAGQQ